MDRSRHDFPLDHLSPQALSPCCSSTPAIARIFAATTSESEGDDSEWRRSHWRGPRDPELREPAPVAQERLTFGEIQAEAAIVRERALQRDESRRAAERLQQRQQVKRDDPSGLWKGLGWLKW